MAAVALAALAGCAHAHVAEAPIAARSVHPELQPHLDAEAKLTATREFLHRGRLAGGVFTSDAIGVTAEIQSDTGARVPAEGPELRVTRRGVYGSHLTAALVGGIYFLFEPLTTALEAQVTEELARALQPSANANANGTFRERASYAITLSAGVADVDEMELEGALAMKVAYLPACGGAATLVLMGAWSGPQGDTATEQWFDRVRVDERAPVCAFIAAHGVVGQPQALRPSR